jgi:hypothetical protein
MKNSVAINDSKDGLGVEVYVKGFLVGYIQELSSSDVNKKKVTEWALGMTDGMNFSELSELDCERLSINSFKK